MKRKDFKKIEQKKIKIETLFTIGNCHSRIVDSLRLNSLTRGTVNNLNYDIIYNFVEYTNKCQQ